MKIEIFPDADAVARKGAEIIAAEARAAVKARVAGSLSQLAEAVRPGRCCVVYRKKMFPGST
jgi:hypothetical protein